MSQFLAFKTIALNEVKRFVRIWPQSLLASALTVFLYFIIFGQVSGGSESYLSFLAPGLILMAVITNSYANVPYSLVTHRMHRSIEEIIIAPISHLNIVCAFIFGGIVRGVFVGLIVTGVVSFFTLISFDYFFLGLGIVVLASTLFSLLGFLNALLANRYEDVVWVPTFILNPLIYLGGVFFPLSILPERWQMIAKINPIYYLIDSFRFSLTGNGEVDAGVSVGILISVVFFVFILVIYMVRKGIGLVK